MKLGIDASNIRSGGGLQHLIEILNFVDDINLKFKKIIIWGGKNTLNSIKNSPLIEKIHIKYLDKSLIHRSFWQKFYLDKNIQKENCDILFVPGGNYTGKFKPVIVINHNLLPFEREEIQRYGFSLFALKLKLLNYTQSKTFKKADGVIYLTEFARERVLDEIKRSKQNSIIIHHGINPKFYNEPKEQKDISEYSFSNPFKLLYVSFIGEYKHQWNVVEAVSELRKKNYPIELILIGNPDEKKAYVKLKNSIEYYDSKNIFIKHLFGISHSEIEKFYKESDLFVFASSCETFGQILTEAMASGLPIACSKMSAMPELLGDAGVYFDPFDPNSISDSIEFLLINKEKRLECSRKAFEKSKTFSWKKCADETFKFIINIKNT